MKYYLSKFGRDWADEFYAEGWTVLDENQYAFHLKLVEEHRDDSATYYFGTNEGWEDTTIGDLASDYSFTEISEDEANTLKRVFKFRGENPSYGIYPDLAEILESMEEWNPW